MRDCEGGCPDTTTAVESWRILNAFYKFAVQYSPELGSQLPTAFIDYEPKPREYLLNTVSTTVQVSTRISAL